MYKKHGEDRKALSMFTDLRMFDRAKEFLAVADMSGEDGKRLIRMKAEWAAKSNEPRAAAEMYLSAGETMKVLKSPTASGTILALQFYLIRLLRLLASTGGSTC